MRLVNNTNNAILAEDLIIAETLYKRMKGLLGRSELKRGEGILLKPCTSVHMLFMRFPIDVMFVDRRNQIIKIIPDLKPWRLTGIYPRAHFCIELPAGTLAATQTHQGDSVQTL